jgi:hypothetical protein
MTPSTVTAIVLVAVIAGVIICLAMILKFLWKVYEHGGPGDVLDTAKALREIYDPEWPSKLFGYLPLADEGQSEGDEDVA